MATWFGGFHNQVVWVFVHHGEIRIIDLWDSVTKAVHGLTSFERQHISKSSGEMCATLALEAFIDFANHWWSCCEC